MHLFASTKKPDVIKHPACKRGFSIYLVRISQPHKTGDAQTLAYHPLLLYTAFTIYQVNFTLFFMFFQLFS